MKKYFETVCFALALIVGLLSVGVMFNDLNTVKPAVYSMLYKQSRTIAGK